MVEAAANDSFMVGFNTSTTTLPPFFEEEYTILIPTIWSIIIIVGCIGNGLVIYTLCKNGEMTPTNCYVVNLAAADLAFIICCVTISAIAFGMPDWTFGDPMCKIFIYMIYVTLHATCFTLTAMTIDRYHAIVNAVTSMNWRSRRASSIVCLCVWSVSCLISLPFALFHGTTDVNEYGIRTYCTEQWPSQNFGKVTMITVIGTTYVIPLAIIIVCYYQIIRNLYRGSQRGESVKREDERNGATTPLSGASQSRRRRKVTRMVAVVVLLFATFWFPIHVYNIYRILIPTHPKTALVYIIKIFGHTLSYANSCVNPFVYAFLNDAFKKAFSKTFPFISRFCPCARITSGDRYTQVTGMVDQAIQAMPGDDNDVNGNGGTELVSMSEHKHSMSKVATSTT